MTSHDLRDTAARLDEILTPHQLRIIALDRGGHSVVQAAAVLGCSASNVEKHRRNIRALCGGCEWHDVLDAHEAAGHEPERRVRPQR